MFSPTSGFHLLVALISLTAGLAIFFLCDEIPFVRYYLGDMVIVIFMYSVGRAVFTSIRPGALAIGIFLFAMAIEILQLLGVPRHFDTRQAWVQILLGSRFQWLDVAMYILGLLLILGIEYKFYSKRN